MPPVINFYSIVRMLHTSFNMKSFIRFNQSEMKRLYRIFKSECPSGLITEEVFHNIFSKFFPLGAESYNGERNKL